MTVDVPRPATQVAMNQRPREVGLPATLGTGILHGCSGSGHLLGVMPALAMPSWSIAFTYLLTFGLGTMLAMSIFTAVVGELSSQMSERLQDPSTPGRLALASSLFALIMGTVSDHFMPALIFVLRHARYSMASARPQSRLELSPYLAASRAGMDRSRALLLHTAPHRSRLVRRGWWTHLRGVERSVISTASCMARSRALLARGAQRRGGPAVMYDVVYALFCVLPARAALFGTPPGGRRPQYAKKRNV